MCSPWLTRRLASDPSPSSMNRKTELNFSWGSWSLDLDQLGGLGKTAFLRRGSRRSSSSSSSWVLISGIPSGTMTLLNSSSFTLMHGTALMMRVDHGTFLVRVAPWIPCLIFSSMETLESSTLLSLVCSEKEILRLPAVVHLAETHWHLKWVLSLESSLTLWTTISSGYLWLSGTWSFLGNRTIQDWGFTLGLFLTALATWPGWLDVPGVTEQSMERGECGEGGLVCATLLYVRLFQDLVSFQATLVSVSIRSKPSAPNDLGSGASASESTRWGLSGDLQGSTGGWRLWSYRSS